MILDKAKMAHEWAMKHGKSDTIGDRLNMVRYAWGYADAMQAEADKRAEQKRKEIREMLNADNTFIEKEGQHFDDVEWQPDWSGAPMGFNRFVVGSDGGYGFFTNMEPQLQDDFWFVGADGIVIKDHGYTGDWQDSLRKRPQ